MNFYTAYELRICSDIEIPELLPWLNGSESMADLHIVAGNVGEEHKQSLSQIGPFLFADEQTILLEVSGIARYQIQSGNHITYQICDGSNENDLRAFLLGSCIGAILMQRDFLVLHGCTIEIDNGCIVCVGHSTSGKSTLAATFMQNGFSVISDDVCAIDSNGMAVPGIPRIKLNQDIADHLDIDTNGLQTIRADCDSKFSLPLGKQFSTSRLPLLAVYELTSEQDNLMIESNLERFEHFRILNKHLYRPRYVKALEKKSSYFQRCCELAQHIHISRIIRPEFQLSANQLKQLIIDDLQQLGLVAKSA